MIQHLLTTRGLPSHTLTTLIERATAFKNQNTHYPSFSKHRAASLFYEPSTRTFMSFTLAASHLSLPLIPLNMQYSSEKKGEAFIDTLQNLSAMGIELCVVRHPDSHIFNHLSSNLPAHLHLINAGDGQHEHPSQALLDLMTIQEAKSHLTDLRIAIVGNLKHSRVTHSFQHLCATVGIKHLTLIAPPIWQPAQLHHGQTTDSLAEGLKDADVVMVLRIQQERLSANERFSIEAYQTHYQLNAKTLKYAKPDAIVLHPGPINRNIEITNEVTDGPQSYILKQVQNGVFMRMAILEEILK